MTHRPSVRARACPWIPRGMLAACSLTATAPAGAEPIRAVVGIVTSQGCGACRAADPVIRDLARQPGVLALTLPVTHWDYLGWKDTLALHPLTERQRAYARPRDARQVFTPHAVVDGAAVATGSDRTALDGLIGEAGRRGDLPVPVRGEARGERILVEVGAGTGPASAAGEVWLVPVRRSRPIAILAGENGGRTQTYVNVVRGLKRLGPWAGQPVRFDVPVTLAQVGEADSWVVRVQGATAAGPGRILGAGKGPGL